MSRPTATSGRKKLLLILLAACALLLAATILGLRNLAERSGRRDEAARLRGETHLRGHRTSSALYQFRLALKINPENLPARVGIVRALTAGKQFDRAIAALRTAVEHGLSPVRADRLHARILASRAEHRFASAGDTANAALCDSIIARELDPAIALIERRLGAAGDQVATLLMLGNLFAKKSGLLRMEHHLLAVQRNRIRDLNRPTLSDGISRQMLNLIPALLSARRKCLGTYRKAIRLAPDSYEPRLALAEYALSLYNPRPDLATEVLKPLLAGRPAHRRGLYLAALAERAAGNFQTALAHIRALRKKRPDEMSNEPDNITLVRTELEIFIDMKRWREAGPLSAVLLKLAPADPFALYIRGLVLLQRQKPAEACNLLQAIFTNTGRRRPVARFALAKALEQLGNRRQAVATFMRVIEDAEATPALDAESRKEILAARYESDVAIAQDLIRGGHFTGALKFASNAFMLLPERAKALGVLRQCSARADKPDFAVPFICLHIVAVEAAHEPRAAIEICRAELAARPGNCELRLLDARLLERAGQHDDAQKLFRTLRRDFPHTPAYAHELAKLLILQGRTRAAEDLYRQLLQGGETDTRALIGLVSVLIAQNNPSSGLAILKRGDFTSTAGRVQKRLLDLYLRDCSMDEAIRIIRSRIETDTSGLAQKYALIAEILWRAGHPEEAKAAFDRAIQSDPDYAPAYRLGLLELEQNRDSDAVAILREAHHRFPRHAGSALNLALALAESGARSDAQHLLQQLNARHTPPEETIPGYRWLASSCQALRAETDALTQSALGPNPEERLRAIIRNHPDLLLARLLLADYFAHHKEQRRALQLLEAALLTATPEQIRIVNRRIDALRQNGLQSEISSLKSEINSPPRAGEPHQSAERRVKNRSI